MSKFDRPEPLPRNRVVTTRRMVRRIRPRWSITAGGGNTTPTSNDIYEFNNASGDIYDFNESTGDIYEFNAEPSA